MIRTQDKKIRVIDDNPERASDQTRAKDDEFSTKELITEVQGQIDEILATRQQWQERQIHHYKNLNGIRPKKTFPWPGCSNLSVPVQHNHLRKLLQIGRASCRERV
jgi:hypothetical protein